MRKTRLSAADDYGLIAYEQSLQLTIDATMAHHLFILLSEAVQNKQPKNNESYSELHRFGSGDDLPVKQYDSYLGRGQRARVIRSLSRLCRMVNELKINKIELLSVQFSEKPLNYLGR